MKLPRVILADDHTILSEALRALLQSAYNVVATVTDGHELVEVALSLMPDVIVVDVAMPILNGLEAARRVRAKSVGIKIVFLTMNEDPDVADAAMRAGASAFLLKTSVASELLQAIHEAIRGRRYVTPRIARAIEESFARNPRPCEIEKTPTPREYEVIQLLAEGKPMKEVGDILNITPRTVAFHKYRAMEKMGLKSSAELVQYAVRTRIVA